MNLKNGFETKTEKRYRIGQLDLTEDKYIKNRIIYNFPFKLNHLYKKNEETIT
jgi:hypothetical protein